MLHVCLIVPLPAPPRLCGWRCSVRGGDEALKKAKRRVKRRKEKAAGKKAAAGAAQG